MAILLEPGAVPIPGYTLQTRLGRGGFGEVWKATAPGGFQVALKFVLLAEAVGPVELRSLETIKDIRHPHLVATFGSWQVENYLIVAMELAERTLLDRFREAAGQGFEGIPAPEIFEHFLDAARGIDYLNEPRHPAGESEPQGIQHRDIKPQNILLIGGSVKVADFGLARVLEHSQTGHTGSMTPAYAAPEFFDRKTSSHSDQYSLAVTYCHMRGGRLPFEGSHMEIMSGHVFQVPDLSMLPPEERPAVARAMAKEPKDRWPSCRTFVKAIGSPAAVDVGPEPETLSLASSAEREPVPAPPAQPSLVAAQSEDDTATIEGGRGSVNRPWVLRGALTAGSVCLLGILTLVLWMGYGAKKRAESTVGLPLVLRGRKEDGPFRPEKPRVRPPESVPPAPRKPIMVRRTPPGDNKGPITNKLGMKLVPIPAGEFEMGSGDDDKDALDNEKPRHRVRITRPFYLGAMEVTRGQFRQVAEPSGLRTDAEKDGKGGFGFFDEAGRKIEQDPKYTWRNAGFAQTDEHPVVNVSWNDAVAYCNALSEKEGLSAYYRVTSESVTLLDGTGYRLPTEAEWEYACRGGSGGTGVYSFGDDASNLGQYAWYRENSDLKTHPVGQKAPNGFGLYDMHGNEWEWCWDGYDKDYYRKSPSEDPTGPLPASDRVLRGGGWGIIPRGARSAMRNWKTPDFRSLYQGFRVARGQSVHLASVEPPRFPENGVADGRDVPLIPVAVPVKPPPLPAPPIGEAKPAARSDAMSRRTPPGDDKEPITNKLGMKLVLIPAGEFEMGSGDADKVAQDDEKPRHRVEITQPFYLGATEVTQGQYQSVIGKNPSYFSAGGEYKTRVAGEDTSRHPVENVSWNDAIAFCNALSERDGLKPYYQFGAGAKSGGPGYRLPTEAEWEYACRGGPGGTGVYSFGDDATNIAQYAWYNEDIFTGKTHPVGEKKPNGFGLYDMHGNVREWCWDGYYMGYYRLSPRADPSGPSLASARVFRGGGGDGVPSRARSAHRSGGEPEDRDSRLGFRVARGLSVR